MSQDRQYLGPNTSKYMGLLISRNLLRLISFIFYVFFIWTVVTKYHSVFLAGMIPAFSMLGYLLVLIPEGHILDTRSRSRTIFISVAALTVTYATLFGFDSLFDIYAVDLVSSALTWIISDSFHSLTKEMVPDEHLQKAISTNQMATGVDDIVGILVGGLFIYIGMFFMVATLVSVSLLSLYLARPRFRSNPGGEKTSFLGVFSIIRKIYPFMVIGFVLNGLFIAIDVYSSGLIYMIYGYPPLYYMLFLLGFPVGVLLGGIIVMKLHGKINEPVAVGLGILIVGTLMSVIPFNSIVAVDPFLTASMGVVASIVNIAIGTIIIRAVPNELTGRFNAFATIFFAGGSPLMAVVFSALAGLVYFPYVMSVAGLVAAILCIPGYLSVKGMKWQVAAETQESTVS